MAVRVPICIFVYADRRKKHGAWTGTGAKAQLIRLLVRITPGTVRPT